MTPENQYLLGGFSVYDGEAQARRTVRHFPLLGTQIAELALDDASGIRFEQTVYEAPHGRWHYNYTLWGTPEAALAAVRRVIPV